MPSFGGLISGVLGRTAEGVGKAADMEMKKQGELDLRKQLLEAETEKQLRIDEIKRGRDIAEEDRKMSSEYLTKVSAADLTKAQNAIANRKTLAPLGAEAGDVEFEANKALEGKKATAAVAAKILETKTLSESDDFIKGETKLSEAKGAAGTKQAQIRADSIRDRPSSSGGAGKITVRSTYTNSDGNKVAVMSDSSERVLGKSSDYDKSVSNLVTKMAKDDYKFAKLPEAEKRKQAELRLRGQLVPPSSGRDLSGLSAYERDAKAD